MSTAPTDAVPGVITLLNQEWQTKHARRTYAFGALGSMLGSELLERITRSTPKAANDALLHEVITLAQQRDSIGEAAGRALVQAMIPTVLQLADRTTALRSVSYSERIGTYVSCLWQAMQAFPAHQHHSVASTLALNTLTIVNNSESHRRARNGLNDLVVDHDDIIEAADQQQAPTERSGDETFRDLVRVLTWAVDTAVLTRDEVSILARFDLGEEDDRDDLQAQHQWSYETMKKKVWRIRRKLMNAVQTMVILQREDL